MKNYYSNFISEEEKNKEILHLTANENIISKNSNYFISTYLSQRYFMGPGKNGKVDFDPFTTLGLPATNDIIVKAERYLKEMLHASIVNINCLSGVHAMMSTILSVTNPGDLVMTLEKRHGGHFATKNIIERIGRKHSFISYDTNQLEIDAKKLKRKILFKNVKAIYLDSSYYINTHDLRKIREAVGNNTLIIYDASHTVGLMIGKQFQQPLLEGADIICANTHKTLPGPHKGIIAFKDKYLGEKANNIIGSSFLSSNQINHTLALANTIIEMKMFGEQYAIQIIKNSNSLGCELEKLGYKVRKTKKGEYSQNHQIHLLTDSIGNYKKLYDRLYKNNINVNFDNVFDKGTFIRIGTQEITRRGMKDKEMKIIAKFIDLSFKKENIKEKVKKFINQYNNVSFSFDKSIRIDNL